MSGCYERVQVAQPALTIGDGVTVASITRSTILRRTNVLKQNTNRRGRPCLTRMSLSEKDAAAHICEKYSTRLTSKPTRDRASGIPNELAYARCFSPATEASSNLRTSMRLRDSAAAYRQPWSQTSRSMRIGGTAFADREARSSRWCDNQVSLRYQERTGVRRRIVLRQPLPNSRRHRSLLQSR